jgi:hypothetical protein
MNISRLKCSTILPFGCESLVRGDGERLKVWHFEFDLF